VSDGLTPLFETVISLYPRIKEARGLVHLIARLSLPSTSSSCIEAVCDDELIGAEGVSTLGNELLNYYRFS